MPRIGLKTTYTLWVQLINLVIKQYYKIESNQIAWSRILELVLSKGIIKLIKKRVFLNPKA